MRPGMRFRGEVEVERVHDVLCLPLEAVDPRPGPPVVTVARGLGSAPVTPRLGRRNDKCIEVLSGLWTIGMYLSLGAAPLAWKLLVQQD